MLLFFKFISCKNNFDDAIVFIAEKASFEDPLCCIKNFHSGLNFYNLKVFYFVQLQALPKLIANLNTICFSYNKNRRVRRGVSLRP